MLIDLHSHGTLAAFLLQCDDELAAEARARETGATPSRLKLEITESMLVQDIEATTAKLTALQPDGVSFSLDDFGTGYSSLAYLQRLPLHELKIDHSFVHDVLSDANDRAICAAVINLGISLGLDVVAEGVESEAQRDCLAALGVHQFQGWLFGCPVPPEELPGAVLHG